MNSRILITSLAMILLANIAWAQYPTEVVLPESVKAAADINNTNPGTIEQYTNPVENFKDSKNEFVPINSVASVGASTIMSKYLSIYNIPIGYSFKSKLLFKGNPDAYENLACKVVIPVAHKMFETFDMIGNPTKYKTTGLGDAVIKLNYILIVNKTFFTFGALAKLPTAKKSNTVKDRDVPLGTGSTDIDLSFYYSKELNSKIAARASLGYDIRTKTEQKGFKYDYGDRINAMVGGDYFLKTMNLGVDFYFSSIAKTTGTFETPGINTLDAMPFVKICLNPSATVTINSFIPILSKWKSAPSGIPDPDRKIKFGVALAYKFVKTEE